MRTLMFVACLLCLAMGISNYHGGERRLGLLGIVMAVGAAVSLAISL